MNSIRVSSEWGFCFAKISYLSPNCRIFCFYSRNSSSFELPFAELISWEYQEVVREKM